MKHMGLFEGIGGFSLAAMWANWQTPVMVEWNPYCQAVLKKNFPDAAIFIAFSYVSRIFAKTRLKHCTVFALFLV